MNHASPAGPRSLQQAAGVLVTGHRPWPLPDAPWLNGQTWESLLFAHWPVPVSTLRPHVPRSLEIETFDGTAWLGITPFRLESYRLRGLPPLPGVSSFYEVNVRTYVTAFDKPGIWFFSLDASSRAAVAAARRAYRLPYFHASMLMSEHERVTFRSMRRDGASEAEIEVVYGPSSDDPISPEPGTLEHFLTERYCLYAEGGGVLYRAEIHHPPWPLQTAGGDLFTNTMPPPGIELPADEPLMHFAARQDVVVWPLRAVTAEARVSTPIVSVAQKPSLAF